MFFSIRRRSTTLNDLRSNSTAPVVALLCSQKLLVLSVYSPCSRPNGVIVVQDVETRRSVLTLGIKVYVWNQTLGTQIGAHATWTFISVSYCTAQESGGKI